jgi:hypothetical protein
MNNPEIERAGNGRGDGGDRPDRHELREGTLSDAPADRADEGQLDGAWTTDGAGRGETVERAGTDRRIQTAAGGQRDGMEATARDADGSGRAGNSGRRCWP